ncbi:CsgG/HfaB family protein [Planctomycetota bacterium]
MTRRCIAALALTLAAVGCTRMTRVVVAPDYHERAPRRIAVLPFADLGKEDKFQFVGIGFRSKGGNAGQVVSDAVAMSLLESGLYEVVDAASIERVLGRQALAAADVLEPANRAKIGAALGVEAVVVGNVTSMEEGYIIPIFWIDGVNGSCRMVELAGGAVLWQAQVQNGVVFFTFPPSGVKRAQAESRRAVRLLANRLTEMRRAGPER